ncbi:MAG: cytochrome c peroxidase [Desulfobaccales bacterium]
MLLQQFRHRTAASWLFVPLIAGLLLTGVPATPARAQVEVLPFPIETPADARAWGFDSLGRMMSGQMPGYPIPHGQPLILNPAYKVPLPPNLAEFVKNRQAALALGKALFWDMQVGSDGIMACASCHFQAGGDVRTKNQVAPAGNQVRYERNTGPFSEIVGFFNAPRTGSDPLETVFGLPWEPNFELAGVDFPLVLKQNAFLPATPVFGDIIAADTASGNRNDVVGSMGLMTGTFAGVTPGSPVDLFSGSLGTMRQTTARNAPSSVNAVFNLFQFWDGRAHPSFNGANPVGPFSQPTPKYFVYKKGKIQSKVLQMQMASLASQSTGPPLSDVEMSFAGRTWPEIGKKLTRNGAMRPLAYQEVVPDDSVLAPYRHSSGKGLDMTYKQLVQAAFRDELWNAPDSLTFAFPQSKLVRTTKDELILIPGEAQITQTQTSKGKGGAKPPPGYTQMEANFALFWGIAVMLYEAELVSPQSPFDKWMEGNGAFVEGFGQKELDGLNVFVGAGKCIACHSGPEFTNVTVRNTQNGREQIEPVIRLDGTPAFYDNGFYNVGITPTVDDLLRGDKGPGNVPWGAARQFLFQKNGIQTTPFPIMGLPIGNLAPGTCTELDADGKCLGTFTPDPASTQLFAVANDPLLGPIHFLVCTDLDGDKMCDLNDNIVIRALDMDGNAKAPGLRNLELNGPYFHNGGAATLQQVLDEYDIGGKFNRAFLNRVDMLPDIVPLGLGNLTTPNGFNAEEALIAFLLALTDPAVKKEAKPFDHPQLFIPIDGTAPILDVSQADFNAWLKSQPEWFKELSATGANGGAELQPFLNLDLFAGDTGKGGIIENQ